MSDEKVIFLAHHSDAVTTEWRENVACRSCRNKTFTLEYDKPASGGGFPQLKCACCGARYGRMGWAPEES